MDVDFANACPLVRPALPHTRFLFVGSRLCSTLPSDGPSRFRPCASLVLHLHQVAQGTFTPKLPGMSDTQAGRWPPPSAAAALTGHGVPLRFATKRSTARCGRAAISNRWFSANFGPLLTQLLAAHNEREPKHAPFASKCSLNSRSRQQSARGAWRASPCAAQGQPSVRAQAPAPP